MRLAYFTQLGLWYIITMKSTVEVVYISVKLQTNNSGMGSIVVSYRVTLYLPLQHTCLTCGMSLAISWLHCYSKRCLRGCVKKETCYPNFSCWTSFKRAVLHFRKHVLCVASSYMVCTCCPQELHSATVPKKFPL